MLIVHVINSLVADGAEKFLSRLCRNMHGYRHHVIALSDLGPVADGLRQSGIPVESIGMRSALEAPLVVFRLARRLRALNPDIVQTWMYYSDLIGGLSAKLAGSKRVVWSIRHSGLSWRDYRATVVMASRLCAALSRFVPDAILVNSLNGRTIHQKLGYRSRIFEVIPNGIDLTRYRPDAEARVRIRRELRLEDDAFVVGMVGRYDPQKGHADFLAAAAAVAVDRPEVRFVLAGRGVDQGNSALAAMIGGHGLANRVMLLGERNDVPALLSAFDLLTLSSIHGEGFPNAVAEAMATGVPCVVTDVGDCADLVSDTGFVIAPGDVVGLSEKIAAAMDLDIEDRRRLGEAARRRIAENFEISRIVGRYEDFYADLLREPVAEIRSSRGPEVSER
jgi:glycosyltransferase involved in cell wall biosynthesis